MTIRAETRERFQFHPERKLAPKTSSSWREKPLTLGCALAATFLVGLLTGRYFGGSNPATQIIAFSCPETVHNNTIPFTAVVEEDRGKALTNFLSQARTGATPLQELFRVVPPAKRRTLLPLLTDPQRLQKEGEKALFTAVNEGDQPSVEHLLRAGVRGPLPITGKNLYDFAKMCSDGPIAQLIARGDIESLIHSASDDVNQLDSFGLAPLHYVVLSRDYTQAGILAKNVDKVDFNIPASSFGLTPYQLASILGDETMKGILEPHTELVGMQTFALSSVSLDSFTRQNIVPIGIAFMVLALSGTLAIAIQNHRGIKAKIT